MESGADVCVQSTHKLAGGLQQTGLIHWREGRVDSAVYPDALDLGPGVVPLEPTDVARAVRYVLEQPANVNVAELVLRPTAQVL